jgi:hypothetical protein
MVIGSDRASGEQGERAGASERGGNRAKTIKQHAGVSFRSMERW